MYISEITIENFRLFGSAKSAFQLSLRPGLTAIVGENDAGKTAVIDALRLVLGTRDQESMRLEVTHFHHAPNTDRATEIKIRLVFSDLTLPDRRAFAEYLTYRDGKSPETLLVLTWVAKRTETDGAARRFMPIEWRTGQTPDGPLLDAGARFLLQATYLRPLRDAERAMSAGRGSRLSQILQHTKEIKEHGTKFDPKIDPSPDPKLLSVLGLGDYSSHLIESSRGISVTRQKLNDDYLRPLSFKGDVLDARVRISGHPDDGTRLRQLLEKLDLNFGMNMTAMDEHSRGLGSNNILFMACELLLLGTEANGFPLLLIEEPEAHLHPQRQVRLMAFLQDQVTKARADGQCIQIIITTHSPNLASDVKLDNLVLIRDRRAFPMNEGLTKLTKSDYRFLQRFLDVTKANLFFARGVVIVEGDAENILIPVLASLIGRNFDEYGVSVVNVGSLGLSRYARIFMRTNPEKEGEISIPVACVTDLDVMPDCAPEIVGKIKEGDAIPPISNPGRRWKVKSDLGETGISRKRSSIRGRANEQHVRSFIADQWTFEYDLAYYGLAEEVYVAVALAKADEDINTGRSTAHTERQAAAKAFAELTARNLPLDKLCSTIYAPLTASHAVSKTITAQYIAEIIQEKIETGEITSRKLGSILLSYLIDAISYVTEPFCNSAQVDLDDQVRTSDIEHKPHGLAVSEGTSV